jgi:hypothetical protein
MGASNGQYFLAMPRKVLPIGDSRLLRTGGANVWIATAVLVLTPGYRALGARYLDALALPHFLM